MTDSQDQSTLVSEFGTARAVRHRRWRHIKDVITARLMAVGGIGVIVAIVLIAFYLLYVVLPLFEPASMQRLRGYDPPGPRESASLYFTTEEQMEIGLRISGAGEVIFFRLGDGEVIKRLDPSAETAAGITSFATGSAESRILGMGYADGTAQVMRHVYKVSYPEDQQNEATEKLEKVITPGLAFPVRETAITLDTQGRPIVRLAVQAGEDRATLLGLPQGGGELKLVHFRKKKSFLSDEVEVTRTDSAIPLQQSRVSHMLVDEKHGEAYIAGGDGTIAYYDISDKENPRLVQKVQAVPRDVAITSLRFLSGGISILVGDSRGQIAQWFPVRDDENNYSLQKIRQFDRQNAAITVIAPEYNRKGFAAGDAAGRVGIYHTTAHQNVALERVAEAPVDSLAFAPRNNGLLVRAGGGPLQTWQVDNEHPEVSLKSIWGKVWYESRQRPEYVWQSSSASSDFEPKFSLTPLAFGTLKAALYAMLFSIPLAIFGAMYTAYFMSARMRGMVKPTIEIMEALPTVILGFLAGLWFAPFVEDYLPGIIIVFIVTPLSVLAAAWAWRHWVPASIRNGIPFGWEAALLIPVVILATWISIAVSQPLELLFFDGNMPLWLTTELGIDFEQRNSLVVGIAMGFAVIPTIFSISEDAIYSVPKHLTTGSLALGATPWQTMTRVVLLTASPGIFSAVMIGLGRAVGETMIVVMATGNTAIMDLNIFQGFRALSANIAVEMPETEVNSTHYRILFLAGLVLFLATFLVNTVAEIVRQRLRDKYSAL